MAATGQKVVATAGTAVALGAGVVGGGLVVKALDTNEGIVAVGNDGAGDVTLANGFRLSKGESIEFAFVSGLDALFVDAATNGEGVCWAMLDV